MLYTFLIHISIVSTTRLSILGEKGTHPSPFTELGEMEGGPTSIDTALLLALTLWISSMNRLCTEEPSPGICGDGRAEGASCVAAGALAGWGPGPPGACWAGFSSAEESCDGWMTTGELCAWWTVRGTTSAFTSPGTPAPGRGWPAVWGASSWAFRTSAAVAFSIATYCAAWAASEPFKSPSVTCLGRDHTAASTGEPGNAHFHYTVFTWVLCRLQTRQNFCCRN